MERQIEVFWIARYDYEPDWRVLPHTHDFFQLFYVLDGEGTAILRAREFALREHRLFLVPPGASHGLAASRGTMLKTLDTKFNVRCEALRSELCRLSGPIDDEGNQIRPILERIRVEGMKAMGWYRELCGALLMQTAVLLLRLHSGEADGARFPAACTHLNTTEDKIRSYIERNFRRDLTLREIGDYIGYTPEYLSSLFSSSTGVSVHHYLMHVRIEHARELLKNSDLPIKEICLECGFKSIHHFSRAFKEAQGMPPAAWREREREGVWKNVVITPGFVNRDITLTEDQSPRAKRQQRTGSA
jgi:AraC-like DNA-binding protein